MGIPLVIPIFLCRYNLDLLYFTMVVKRLTSVRLTAASALVAVVRK